MAPDSSGPTETNRIRATWSGAPGLSGFANFEIRKFSSYTELWEGVDAEIAGEYVEELRGRSEGTDWRTSLSLIADLEPIPLIGEPAIEGVSGMPRELFVLALGSEASKCVVNGLLDLSDEQLHRLADKIGPFSQSSAHRELLVVQEALDEGGWPDVSWPDVYDRVMAAWPDLSEIQAWVDEIYDERKAQAKAKARAAQQKRDEALQPYREQLDRLIDAIPKSAPPEISGPAAAMVRGLWDGRQKRQRSFIIRTIEDSFIATGKPPTGAVTAELPGSPSFGPKTFTFAFDFDALVRSAFGTEPDD